MINLEKLFQRDDEIFVTINYFIQSFVIFTSLYISSILDENIIYDLLTIKLFVESRYFYFVIVIFFLHVFSFIFIKKNKNYIKTFYYFIFYELKIFLLSFLICFIIFIYFSDNRIDYLWFFNALAFSIICLFLLKIFTNQLYRYLIINNIIQRNIILIAKYKTIKDFIEIYKNKQKKSLIKCCIITDVNPDNYFNELKIPVFKYDQNFFDILNYHHIGQIWFEVEKTHNEDNQIKIEDLLKYPFDIKLFLKDSDLNIINFLTNKFNIASASERRKNHLFFLLNNSRFTGVPLLMKFLIDKIFSLLIFVLTLPLLSICIFLIIVEDGFPFIFSQTRSGWDGRKFKIYKLRTLKKINFDKSQQVIKNDPRLLFFGKFIRKYSIDELPQIYNVIKGDMSIVGPRPHMIEHSKKYSNIIQNFLTRHKCNPGITGWAQIHGYRGATPNDDLMKKRLDYDIWYLKNWSLGLDFMIMFKTIFAIFKYRSD